MRITLIFIIIFNSVTCTSIAVKFKNVFIINLR